MPRIRFLFSAALASTMIATAAGAAPRCWQPHEYEAAQLRHFQSLLMVGTLQCRGRDRLIEGDYNRFVHRNRTLLDDHNRVLRAHFVRSMGTRHGERAYDRFATRLANNHASGGADRGFCRTAATLTRLAASSHPRDVAVLARTVAGEPPLRAPMCKVSYYADYGRAPAGWSSDDAGYGVTVHRAATPALAAAPIAQPPAPPAAAAAEAFAAEAIQVAPAQPLAQTASAIAVPDPVPLPQAAAGPSQAEALQAAVAALQSATAALALIAEGQAETGAGVQAAPRAVVTADPDLNARRIADAPIVAPGGGPIR